MDNLIQALWIGSCLSAMEQLCISSFLMKGHEYHLYVYDNVKNVPEGTVVKDGNDVLPASMLFQYTHFQTYAAFSNFFRYKLLLEKGGWWVDTDIACLKPFAFDDEYVFATESVAGKEVINSGIIKAPAGSDVMAFSWQICQTKEPEALSWGEVGSKLMANAIERFSLESYVRPYTTFCPIGYKEWAKVLDASVPWEFDKQTYAVHLWNEMWRRANRDKNQLYHPDCLYETLKRQYWRP